MNYLFDLEIIVREEGSCEKNGSSSYIYNFIWKKFFVISVWVSWWGSFLVCVFLCKKIKEFWGKGNINSIKLRFIKLVYIKDKVYIVDMIKYVEKYRKLLKFEIYFVKLVNCV